MKTNRELQSLVFTPEQQKTGRQRNVATGIAIGCFVLSFYAVTTPSLVQACSTGHCERGDLKIAR